MSKLYWRKTLPILLATCVAGQFAAAQDSGDELEELQTLTFTGTRLTGAEVEGSLPHTRNKNWLTIPTTDRILFEYDGDEQWVQALNLASQQMVDQYF